MTSPTNTPANAPGSHDAKKNAPDAKSPVASDPKTAAASVTGASHVASPVPVPASKAPGTTAAAVPTQNQGAREPKTDSGRPSVPPIPGVVPSPAAVSSPSPVAGSTPSLHTSPRDPKPIVPNDPAQPKRSAPVQAANESQAGAGDSSG